jgi:hypothetical protein
MWAGYVRHGAAWLSCDHEESNTYGMVTQGDSSAMLLLPDRHSPAEESALHGMKHPLAEEGKSCLAF